MEVKMGRVHAKSVLEWAPVLEKDWRELRPLGSRGRREHGPFCPTKAAQGDSFGYDSSDVRTPKWNQGYALRSDRWST